MRRLVLFGEELRKEVVIVVSGAGDEFGGSGSILNRVDVSHLEELSYERTIRDNRWHLKESSNEEVCFCLTRYESGASDEESEFFG